MREAEAVRTEDGQRGRPGVGVERGLVDYVGANDADVDRASGAWI